MVKFNSSPDVAGGGSFLSKPGVYHLVVTEAYDGKKPNGDVYDGAVVVCAAVDGNVRDEKGVFTEKDKTINLFFSAPKMSAKDGGKFSERKLTALALAGDLVSPDKLGTPNLEIDFSGLRGRQIVAKLELGEANEQGRQFLDLSFSDVFHVDDPRVKAIPKSQEHLGIVPKERRHEEAWFKAALEKKHEPKSESQNAPLDPSLI